MKFKIQSINILSLSWPELCSYFRNFSLRLAWELIKCRSRSHKKEMKMKKRFKRKLKKEPEKKTITSLIAEMTSQSYITLFKTQIGRKIQSSSRGWSRQESSISLTQTNRETHVFTLQPSSTHKMTTLFLKPSFHPMTRGMVTAARIILLGKILRSAS